jgi:hypothetical protein
MKPDPLQLSPVLPIDTESYRAANLLLRQFGDDAPAHAAQWIAEMKMDGDEEAASFWGRVHQALKLLLSETKPENITTH